MKAYTEDYIYLYFQRDLFIPNIAIHETPPLAHAVFAKFMNSFNKNYLPYKSSSLRSILRANAEVHLCCSLL